MFCSCLRRSRSVACIEELYIPLVCIKLFFSGNKPRNMHKTATEAPEKALSSLWRVSEGFPEDPGKALKWVYS